MFYKPFVQTTLGKTSVVVGDSRILSVESGRFQLRRGGNTPMVLSKGLVDLTPYINNPLSGNQAYSYSIDMLLFGDFLYTAVESYDFWYCWIENRIPVIRVFVEFMQALGYQVKSSEAVLATFMNESVAGEYPLPNSDFIGVIETDDHRHLAILQKWEGRLHVFATMNGGEVREYIVDEQFDWFSEHPKVFGTTAEDVCLYIKQHLAGALATIGIRVTEDSVEWKNFAQKVNYKCGGAEDCDHYKSLADIEWYNMYWAKPKLG